MSDKPMSMDYIRSIIEKLHVKGYDTAGPEKERRASIVAVHELGIPYGEIMRALSAVTWGISGDRAANLAHDFDFMRTEAAAAESATKARAAIKKGEDDRRNDTGPECRPREWIEGVYKVANITTYGGVEITAERHEVEITTNGKALKLNIDGVQYVRCKICDEFVHEKKLYNPDDLAHNVCAACVAAADKEGRT